MRYGHFTVETIEERHYAHYSIRKFEVCNRKVLIILKRTKKYAKQNQKILQKISKIYFFFRFALKLDGGNIYEYMYL